MKTIYYYILGLATLLLLTTACSNDDEQVGTKSNEVELTLQTEVSNMITNARAIPDENITSITALAFDAEAKLIKVVKATLSNNESTRGTLRIKVPSRTRKIHFLAKNGRDFTDITSEQINEYESELLNQTVSELYYWGLLSYNNENELKNNQIGTLYLYRNQAKVTLEATEGSYIVGFLKYNAKGSMVPTNDYSMSSPTIPNDVGNPVDDIEGNYGTEVFLFEHNNDKNNYPLYAICKIGDLYYKIAFASSSENYYKIIRNHHYRIVINDINTEYGETSYSDAVNNAQPINDIVIVETDLTISIPNNSFISYKGSTCEVTVTIPENMKELSVTSISDAFEITPPEGLTANDGKYDVSGKTSVTFTLTLKDSHIGQTGSHNVSFSGRGKYLAATGTGTITLNPFMDSYELWFVKEEQIDTLKGSDEDEFRKFYYTLPTQIDFYNGNEINLESTFYDSGADNHKTYGNKMGSDDIFTFTIPDTRYLTLLVARKPEQNKLNINIDKDNNKWTTEGKSNNTYDFSEENIVTTSGRIIRYELPAGTYTLSKGNTEYLLYYMRVTQNKPTMTDIVQPNTNDYALTWEGGDFGNDTKIGDIYYVDDDAKTLNVTFNNNNSLGITSGSLSSPNLSLTDLNSIDSYGASSINGWNTSYTITDLNAGTYAISGQINQPQYSLSHFYDKVVLKPVDIKVKNAIKLRLVKDWGAEKVDSYTINDSTAALALYSPATKPITSDFSYTLNDWQRKEGHDMYTQNGTTFTIASQTETDNNGKEYNHPFTPGYTYLTFWGDFRITDNNNRRLETMVPTIADNVDACFSYLHQIGKNVTLPGIPVIKIDFPDTNITSGDLLTMKVTIPNGLPSHMKIYLEINTQTETVDWREAESAASNEGYKSDIEKATGNIEDTNFNLDWNHFVLIVQEGKTEYNMYWKPKLNNENEIDTLDFNIKEIGHGAKDNSGKYIPYYWTTTPGDTTSVTRQITINKAQASQ